MSEEEMTHEQFLDLFGNIRISDTKKIQAYYGQIIDKLQKENQELSIEKLDQICKGVEEEVLQELREEVNTLRKENQELKDLKAELQAEVIKNQHLEDKLKVYEQQIDLEWVEENYIEKRILKRAEKIIDLMAEQMSKRPLMIFQGNEKENSIQILKEPKEIIDYYTKKAEEENDNRDTD